MKIGRIVFSKIDLSFFTFGFIDKQEERIDLYDSVIISDKQKDVIAKWIYSSRYSLCELDRLPTPSSTSQAFQSLAEATSVIDQVEISKQLFRDFYNAHQNTSSTGVIAMMLFTLDDSHKIVMVTKLYDSPTITWEKTELADGTIQAELQDNVAGIGELGEKYAKLAIVSCTDHYDWKILADDRQKPGAYKIADFFCSFLNGSVKPIDSKLTIDAVRDVAKWAKTNRDSLPEQLSPSECRAKAVDHMCTANAVDIDSLVQYIIPETADIDGSLRHSLQDYLDTTNLNGRKFSPKPDSLSASDRKSQILTDEGVKVLFDGSKASNNITIEDTNDFRVIKIKTRSIKES